MGFIIAGVVLLALAGILLFVRKRSQGHLLEIKFMQSTPVDEIIETHRSIADELGPGGFSQLVETKGVVVCDAPVTGELSGQPCAYYTMQIEERYEETYWEEDAEGRRIERTRSGNQTVASNTVSGQFAVQDGAGRIRINPDGAKLDLQQSVNRFEPMMGGSTLSFGSFSMDFTPTMMPGRRILGYHYSESILPIGRNLYVVGQARDTSGELLITRPEDKTKPFIVSLKSEEEITGGIESKAKWLFIGAIASGAIGLVLIIMGAMKK